MFVANTKAFRFQSTLSVRRATNSDCQCISAIGISIHALREESDRINSLKKQTKYAISIHALREESDGESSLAVLVEYKFQSTLSVRRATICSAKSSIILKFQSTLSVRRATICSAKSSIILKFQSTLSVRRATE